jgi:hypothetical protein
MKIRSRGVPIVLALIVALSLSGCGTTSLFSRLIHRNHVNDYGEIHKKLDADAIRYSLARHVVVDDTETRRIGVVTDPQFREFQVYEQNVIDAEALTDKDLADWAKDGSRPVSFDGHAKTLLDAQNKLIAFTRTVKP